MATALGVSGIQNHSKRVRFYSTVELVNTLEQEKAELPKTLIIPNHQVANLLQIEAESQGITVVRVPEDQLMLFIGEARTGFKEHLGGSGMQ